MLKQLVANPPYLDSTRIGILGASIGGYFAVRAMLEALELFRLGVAMTPVYDRLGGLGAVWRGTVDEKQLDDDPKSNLLRMVGRLQGRFLIIHGASDLNAPWGGTMRMIGALEQAGKSYHLVLLPEMDHAAQNSTYSLRSVKRYLSEHLGVGK